MGTQSLIFDVAFFIHVIACIALAIVIVLRDNRQRTTELARLIKERAELKNAMSALTLDHFLDKDELQTLRGYPYVIAVTEVPSQFLELASKELKTSVAEKAGELDISENYEVGYSTSRLDEQNPSSGLFLFLKRYENKQLFLQVFSDCVIKGHPINNRFNS